MQDRNGNRKENVISVNKLVANIKSYWWICILLLACGVFITVRDTKKEYNNNVALASRDMYVSGADFYFDSDADKDTSVWTVIISSQTVREKIQNKMVELYQDELRDNDTYYIQDKGSTSCYGITVIGEGEAHTLALAKSVAAAFEEAVLEFTGETMRPIDLPEIANPCIVLQSGTILTFSQPEDRAVSLSLNDFISWKKMMVVMACAFMGLVIIFVLILFDNKVRGKEEVDAICNKACVAALNNKKERATAIIKVQHLLSENVEDKLVMATLNNGKAFDKVCEVLNEAITGQVTFADNICKNAEGLFTCSNKKRVILIVEQDRDTVGELREAMKNLELVNAALIGYILV